MNSTAALDQVLASLRDLGFIVPVYQDDDLKYRVTPEGQAFIEANED